MKARFGLLVAIGVGGAVLELECALAAAQGLENIKVPAPILARPLAPPAPEAAPPAPPAPPAAVAPAVPGIEQLTQQYRPYLCVEYHLFRTVCALTEDQRKPIAREVERMFRKVLEQYHEMRQPGRLRPPGQPAQALLVDPHKLIQDGMARVADEHLTPEQAARYRAELTQRAQDRKRVAIRSIVERLDEALFLSREQRIHIATMLNSRWDEKWFTTEYMLLNPERYLFRIPAAYITIMLDEDQKRLWEDNFSQRIATATAVAIPRTVPDSFPEDEELAEARVAEAKLAGVTP
jgi:hypothetical protein